MVSLKRLTLAGWGLVAMIVVTTGLAPHSAHAAPSFSVDTLLGSASPADSGFGGELAWLRHFSGDSLLTASKIDTDVLAIADDGNWYVDAGNAAPGYFMLKFGTGTTNQASHYFFINDGVVGDSKLVWSNLQVNFLTGGGDCFAPDGDSAKHPKTNDLSACNGGRLSHFAFGGTIDTTAGDSGGGAGTSTEVPVPGTLALAALGLLGLAGARRKFNKKS